MISSSNPWYGSFVCFDRYAVFYSGHVSSLANDSHVPAKNRKPRAITRIADALFFRENLFISRRLLSWNQLPHHRKKGKDRERRSHSYDEHLIHLADRKRRCLLKVAVSVSINSQQYNNDACGNNAIFLLWPDKAWAFCRFIKSSIELRTILLGLLNRAN